VGARKTTPRVCTCARVHTPTHLPLAPTHSLSCNACVLLVAARTFCASLRDYPLCVCPPWLYREALSIGSALHSNKSHSLTCWCLISSIHHTAASAALMQIKMEWEKARVRNVTPKERAARVTR
jgi:hypothetical protein